MARVGIWKCPECHLHQTWKTRSHKSNKLDRRCKRCEKRVRTTLDRSASGKGRVRNIEIWERSAKDLASLEEEVKRRNEGSITDSVAFVNEKENELLRSNTPKIWGKGWIPTNALDFPSKLKSKTAKSSLLEFVAERHDGHLTSVSECWDSMECKEKMTGEEFHEFSRELMKVIEERYLERTLEPDLSGLAKSEIIPMRQGEVFLKRRLDRLIIDLTLCMRRIAHYASITVENRIEWQRRMIRTRLVDEELKDLFTNGLPTPDGGSFGGKGFRSTWQEGVVACASAMTRAVDLPEENRHNADIVAPMIRDMGLALSLIHI